LLSLQQSLDNIKVWINEKIQMQKMAEKSRKAVDNAAGA